MGGEGGFLVHASGEGEVVAACYGALDTITLGQGEKVVVDSGHMVAYDDTVQMSTRRVAGTMASMKSGEGLVFEFTGPGEVLTQTRNPSALISWLTTVLPFTRQSTLKNVTLRPMSGHHATPGVNRGRCYSPAGFTPQPGPKATEDGRLTFRVEPFRKSVNSSTRTERGHGDV